MTEGRAPDPALIAENAGVLRYLGDAGDTSDPRAVSIQRPPPAETDRWQLGAHPDVVERLWDVLNGALPRDGRALIAGGPALIDPGSGRVLAVALGTQYAVWLAPSQHRAALAAGCQTVHVFGTVGRTLELPATFGPGWVFGAWLEAEHGWLAESAAATNL